MTNKFSKKIKPILSFKTFPTFPQYFPNEVNISEYYVITPSFKKKKIKIYFCHNADERAKLKHPLLKC